MKNHSSLRPFALSSLLLLAAASQAAGFQNGSFETSTAAANPGTTFVTLPTGSTAITGWTVGGGGLDYIGGTWQASAGSRSLDLSGLVGTAGSIAQTFDTVVGQAYAVTFDMAGNYGGAPTVKTMNVSAAGQTQTYTFDVTGHSANNMGWTPKSFAFVALATASTLQFSDTATTGYGPALDNVSVQAVPEPTTVAALGLGALGLLRRRRKA